MRSVNPSTDSDPPTGSRTQGSGFGWAKGLGSSSPWGALERPLVPRGLDLRLHRSSLLAGPWMAAGPKRLEETGRVPWVYIDLIRLLPKGREEKTRFRF